MRDDGLDESALRRLLEIGGGLVAEHDVEVVLERVLEVAQELTGARYAAVGVLDGGRTELSRFITAGIDEPTHEEIGDLPRGHGILGELIRNPEPLRLTDLTEHPRSYGFPPAHPRMQTFLGVPILIRGEVWGNLYVTEKEGGPFDEGDENALVVLARWAAIAIDNARLYTDLERQRNELGRAVRDLEATTSIARAVGGETDLSRLMELVVKRARALVDARSVLILLRDDEGLTLAAGAGDAASAGIGASLSARDPILAVALEEHRPERLAEIHPRLQGSLGGLLRDAASVLIVPLVFRGACCGMLIAVDRLDDVTEFSIEDERLMTAFAASAAVAVATARTVEAQRLGDSLRAADEERKRWARELHDETLQGLGALQVMLAGVRGSGDPDALIDVVRDHLNGEIDRLQAMITQLRPAALDEIGLGPALEHLIRRLDGELSVELQIDLDYESGREPSRLDLEIESTAYRVIQEALNNVRKHSGASNARVLVAEADGFLTIEVSDSGVGFDTGASEAGYGIVGMKERLALVHGRVEVSSVPGEGTTVKASLPTRRAFGGGGTGSTSASSHA